ncbi:MAG: hypothetical protein SGJ17_11295 [Hyphomicrobiales bacterium]|nr:hypothetical protein [Hyphomicrobiales bacterium]
MTPDRARDIITRRLLPGERLIWHDAPTPWRIASRYLFRIAIGAFFTFSGLSQVIADKDTPSTGSTLVCAFGVCFVGWSLRQAANGWYTAYGLTNQRAIIAVGDRGSTQSFTGDAFQSVQVRGESHGSLSLTILQIPKARRAMRMGSTASASLRGWKPSFAIHF